MVPVVRIDNEVLEYLQQRARPLVETPNDVLRRVLGMNRLESSRRNASATVQSDTGESTDGPLFIVVNAAGDVPNDKNAFDCKRLTHRRVNSGADIVAPNRFADARRMIYPRARIVMHQGGAKKFRSKYGAGQLVAAGRVIGEPRELSESDKNEFRNLYELTLECYPNKPLVGILIYDFPKGIAERPLPKEEARYSPGRGDNFIKIVPSDSRYRTINEWWNANY